MWLDFVCINQDDHDERKQQVELMYHLYSKADRVLAYLRHETDGSEHIPELLNRIQKAHFKKEDDEDIGDKLFIPLWKEVDLVGLGLPPAITNSGCVGMVPRCTQKVDSIVVIKEVNLPMVLRQGENR